MRHEPFHQRTWAELIFFFTASAAIGLMGGWRFLRDGGDWPALASCALGIGVAILMGEMIRRKRSTGRSQPSREENG